MWILMCGRFNLNSDPADLAEFFGLEEAPELPPRFNIVLTQCVFAIRQVQDDLMCVTMRWSFSPHWNPGKALINARCEMATIVLCLKELATALLVSPPGIQTLAVRLFYDRGQ